MSDVRIFHNPNCSKSRAAIEMLKDLGLTPKIVEYLREPLSKTELLLLMEQIDVGVSELVRTKDEIYQRLGFELSDKGVVAEHLAMYPELLERPIVVQGSRAVLARPAEKLRIFFQKP